MQMKIFLNFIDFNNFFQILDDEIFERVQEYFTLYGKTSREISSLETRCCDKILEESEMVSINKVKHFRGSKLTGDMVL